MEIVGIMMLSAIALYILQQFDPRGLNVRRKAAGRTSSSIARVHLAPGRLRPMTPPSARRPAPPQRTLPPHARRVPVRPRRLRQSRLPTPVSRYGVA